MSDNYRRTLLQLVLGCVIGIFAASTTLAQKVTYDWSSNSKTADAPRLNRTQPVTFEITNVNDILFSYELEVTQKATDFDDFGLIQKVIPAKIFTGAGQCMPTLNDAKSELQKAIDAIDRDPKLPAGYAKTSPHVSVSLQDSRKAWNDLRANEMEAAIRKAEAAISVCGAHPDLRKFLDDAYNPFKKRVDSLNDKVNNTPHIFIRTKTLSPGGDVTATVYEQFGTVVVSTKTFSFTVADTTLTLSAGPLFTGIPDRSYQSRKTPAGPDNVVVVENNSRLTPGIVALLNYSLGAVNRRLDGENTGLALSAGPVVRFGTQGTSSSFGFFTGVSAHLRHRFFFTPGFHFGQFADFPVGFGAGSKVPANFGELNPVKRWTTKFGFAITYRTKDFKSLEGSANVSGQATASASPSPSPAASPSPSPSPSASASPSPETSASLTVSSPPNESSNNSANDTNGNIGVKIVDASNAASASSTDGPEKSRLAAVRVNSLNIIPTPKGERLVVDAGCAIADYSYYAQGSRFYLVIQRGRLDAFQNALRARLLGDARVERRGADLILSFAIPEGTLVQVAEGPFGLDLLFSKPEMMQRTVSNSKPTPRRSR